ncbi:SDR family oxidoreductase [Epibacterium ulvae]|uniref:SDR family oxidoreductase n=1 Tax=Epibacterium ulvae TaxID=1156985 RepID=UPI002491C469|nr:SDR family oxidoreductase [Epibacterium ulvae]
MKVLVLGGSGVFGSRLAQLLVRDQHEVTIAGRQKGALDAYAAELGCAAKQMDRTGDLSALGDYDVVVDAAGPFHAYEGDPYRVARAAIACGVHYLDLSDDAAFCAGITSLEAEAKSAGVCVLSGMSTVPALSSAAVRSLAGSQSINALDIAILPGNQSPRGLSVMASILSQAGRPMRIFRAGRWEYDRGWSDPKRYMLPGQEVRQGFKINVPDTLLFPAHFKAQTVVFRAGLELAVMRYGLWVFAMLRRFLPIPITPGLLRMFKGAADLLAPFGSGAGGMVVEVTAKEQRHWWRLRADAGDGPYIPAIAIRTLLRSTTLPIGAQPALEIITLDAAEAAMSDLQVSFERESVDLKPIFAEVLGEAFSELPISVQSSHCTPYMSRWQGRASVERGKSLWSRLLAAVFGFPGEAADVSIEVTKTISSDHEVWQRKFGKHIFRSTLRATPKGMTERFGPFTFLLGLEVKNGSLFYPVKSARLGPVSLPKWLLPISNAREFEAQGRFHFDVELRAPLTGRLLVHYKGELSEVSSSDTDRVVKRSVS